MSFAYLNGVITQSGIDTDLSGLVGLTDVTVSVSGGGNSKYAFYSINNARLLITGTLTHNPDKECMEFNRTPSVGTEVVRVSGTYNYGATYTGNGRTNYAQGVGLIFTAVTNEAWQNAAVYVELSGTWNWDGGTIVSGSPIEIENGATVTQNSGTFFITATTEHQIRIESDNATSDAKINFNSITLDGITHAPSIFTLSSWNAMVINFRFGAFQDYVLLAPSATLENANFIGNRLLAAMLFNSMAQGYVSESVWLNPGELVIARGKNTTKYGLSTSRRDVSLNLTDVLGANAEDTKFYAIDEDSGNRRAINGIDYTADQIYQGTSVVGVGIINGVIINVQTLLYGTTVALSDDRFTDDEMDLALCGYSYLLSQPVVPLYGNNTLQYPWTMLPDTLITESDKSIVDAYPEIDDAFKGYDRAKAHLVDIFGGQTEVLIGRSGSQFDIGADNLTFDAAAGSVIALSGADVTFKSSLYTGGVTSTTGSVYVNNGTVIQSGVFDCTVFLNSLVNLTDVNAEKIIFSVAGTYTFHNCIIGEVTNTSGGNVIINVTGTVTVATNTGPNITINNSKSLTISNIPENAILSIFDDENPDVHNFDTRLAYEASVTGGSYVFQHSGANNDIILQVIMTEYEEITKYITLTGADSAEKLVLVVDNND